MNILFAAAELSPYAKTGGLGEAVTSLAQALHQKGHSISIAIPLYRETREKFPELTKTGLRLSIPNGQKTLYAHVWQGTTDKGIMVFAIQRDEFYDRSFLYGNEEGEYADNCQRFAFFSRAVAELCKYIEPQLDLVHVHDWHVALVPAYLRALGMPLKSVLSIHNIAFQGAFHPSEFINLGLPDEYFSPQGVEFFGRVNFLKAGILLSQALVTVSPNYAKEIQHEQFGFGLHEVLRENAYKLSGILNGIDTEKWNPTIDKYIVEKYSAKKLTGKSKCQEALLKEFKFKKSEGMAVIGIVSRLTRQKGIDLLLEIMPELLEKKVVLIIHGSGDHHYEIRLQECSKKNPDQVKFKIGYSEELARRIMAGSDFTLMPSEYEPCGLNQMFNLRYGTIPIVRDTGGLSDSIQEWDGENGAGFKFVGGKEALLEKINTALAVKNKKREWLKLKRNAMQEDFSWDKSVEAYTTIYKKVMN
jgi:starch synthase